MTSVTEFAPPEDLFPHEAPFLLAEKEDDAFQRAMATALLELADEGLMTYDAVLKRPVVRLSPDRSTPFFRKIAEIYPPGKQHFVWMLGIEKHATARLRQKGWLSKGTQRTPAGEEACRKLLGYREYLRKAMMDRVHFDVIEGRVGRDALFAAGLGVISVPNVFRAAFVRSGNPVEGSLASFHNFFGGRPEVQHAISIQSSRKGRGCAIAFMLVWAAVVATMIFVFFQRQ
ncbi:MAG: hypothetical protein WC866_00615 [Patescibacteria group bacterium]|jgi:hypothetical protein